MALYRDPYARLRELSGQERTAAPVPDLDAAELARQQRRIISESRSSFVNNVEAGIDDIKASGYTARGLARTLVGDDAGGIRDIQTAKDITDQANEFGVGVNQLSDVNDFGSALEYAGNGLARLAPQIALGLATGGTGGVARAGLAKAGERGAERLLTERLVAGAAGRAARRQGIEEGGEVVLSREVADRAARRAARLVPRRSTGELLTSGAKAGTLASSITGQTALAQDIMLDPDAEGSAREKALKASAGAVLTGALDALPIMHLLGRYGLGEAATKAVSGGLVKRVAKNALAQGTEEGLMEAAQSFGERATHKWVNDNIDLLSPDAISDYVNSAAMGFVGGGVFGAPGGLRGAKIDSEAGKRYAQATRDFFSRLRVPLNPNDNSGGGAANPDIDVAVDLDAVGERIRDVAGKAGAQAGETLSALKTKGQKIVDNVSDLAKRFLDDDAVEQSIQEVLDATPFSTPEEASGVINPVRLNELVAQYPRGDRRELIARALVPDVLKGGELAADGTFAEVSKLMKGAEPEQVNEKKIDAFLDAVAPEQRGSVLSLLRSFNDVSTPDADESAVESAATPATKSEADLTAQDLERGDFQEFQKMDVEQQLSTIEPQVRSAFRAGATLVKKGAAAPEGALRFSKKSAKTGRTYVRAFAPEQLGAAVAQMGEQVPGFRNLSRTQQLVTVLSEAHLLGHKLDPASVPKRLNLGNGWIIEGKERAALITGLQDSQKAKKERAPSGPAPTTLSTHAPARAQGSQQQQAELNREYGGGDTVIGVGADAPGEQGQPQGRGADVDQTLFREGADARKPRVRGVQTDTRATTSNVGTDTRARRVSKAQVATDDSRRRLDSRLFRILERGHPFVDKNGAAGFKSDEERRKAFAMAMRHPNANRVVRVRQKDGSIVETTDRELLQKAAERFGLAVESEKKATRKRPTDKRQNENPRTSLHEGETIDADAKVDKDALVRERKQEAELEEDDPRVPLMANIRVLTKRRDALARQMNEKPSKATNARLMAVAEALRKKQYALRKTNEELGGEKHAPSASRNDGDNADRRQQRIEADAQRAEQQGEARDSPAARAVREGPTPLESAQNAEIESQRSERETRGTPKDERPGDAAAGRRLAFKMREASNNPHVAKDSTKARRATAFIGDGAPGSSTRLYNTLAKEVGILKTEFAPSDVVFVSVNGQRPGRVAAVVDGKLSPAFKALDAAIEAGATIITDDKADRARSYNVGEREIAAYLEARGYKADANGNVWTLPRESSASADENNAFSLSENGIDSYIEGTRSRAGLISLINRLVNSVDTPTNRRRLDAARAKLASLRASVGAAARADGSANNRMNARGDTFNKVRDTLLGPTAEDGRHPGPDKLTDALSLVRRYANEEQVALINALLKSGAVEHVRFNMRADAKRYPGQVAGAHVYSENNARALDSRVDLIFGPEAGVVAQDPIAVLLHEATHAATSYAERTTPRVRRELSKLLAHVRTEAAKKGIDVDALYGLSETQEFLAEAFSNAEFQNLLRSIQMPGEKKTVWDHFADFVARVLGVERSALDAALEIGAEAAAITAEAREQAFFDVFGLASDDSASNVGGNVPPGGPTGIAVTPASGSQPTDYFSLLSPDSRRYIEAMARRGDIYRQVRAALSPDLHNVLDSADEGPALLVNTMIGLELAGQLGKTYNKDAFAGAVQGLWEIISATLNLPSKRVYGRAVLSMLKNGVPPADIDAPKVLLPDALYKVHTYVNNRVKPSVKAFIGSLDASMRTTGVPALTQLATLLSQRTGEFRADGAQSLTAKMNSERNQRLNSFFDVLEGMDQPTQQRVLKELQSHAETVSPEAQRLRDEFQRMYQYLRTAGVRKEDGDLLGEVANYFPVAMDLDKMTAGGGAPLRALLTNFPEQIRKKQLAALGKQMRALREIPAANRTEEEKQAIKRLNGLAKKIARMTPEELAQREYDTAVRSMEQRTEEDITFTGGRVPQFRAANNRMMDYIYTDGTPEQINRFVAFQDSNLERVVVKYVDRATRRAEFSRLGLYQRIPQLLSQAAQQGANPRQLQMARDYVDMVMGVYGNNYNPVVQKIADSLGIPLPDFKKFQAVQSALLTYQNFRLLPLAAMSSLIDPLGVSVRAGGDLKTTFGSYRAAARAVRDKTGGDALAKLAQSMGIVERHAISEALIHMYGTIHDPTGRTTRLNSLLFKYNGLSYITRFSRLAALAAGNDFLLKHAASNTEQSAKFLQELGLKRDDIQAGADGYVLRNDKVAAALNRFVDESVVRPTPGSRPGWHNDPNFQLAAQYKGYLYAFYNTVVRRGMVELGKGNPAVLLPLLMYIPITIMGEVLRDAFQDDGDDKDALDYAKQGVTRSGLLGPQIGSALDFKQSVQAHGGHPLLESVAGPTGQQIGDMYDTVLGQKETGQTLEEALPGSALYKKWE